MNSKLERATGGSKNTMPAMEREHQAREDCRILQQAHDIMGDKSRMKCASDHAKAQMATLAKVAGAAMDKGARTSRSKKR